MIAGAARGASAVASRGHLRGAISPGMKHMHNHLNVRILYMHPPINPYIHTSTSAVLQYRLQVHMQAGRSKLWCSVQN